MALAEADMLRAARIRERLGIKGLTSPPPAASALSSHSKHVWMVGTSVRSTMCHRDKLLMKQKLAE